MRIRLPLALPCEGGCRSEPEAHAEFVSEFITVQVYGFGAAYSKQPPAERVQRTERLHPAIHTAALDGPISAMPRQDEAGEVSEHLTKTACQPEKPVAYNYGLLSTNNGLLWDIK